MPRVRRRGHVSRNAELTREHRIDLAIGPAGGSSHLFESDAERRDFYLKHRDELRGRYGWRNFRRPQAWWKYESADYLHDDLRQTEPGRYEDYMSWFVRNKVPLEREELALLRSRRPDLARAYDDRKD